MANKKLTPKVNSQNPVGRASPGTIGAHVEFLIGKKWSPQPDDSFLSWPPNAFGVAMTLLRDSGAYLKVTDKWPPTLFNTRAEYIEAVEVNAKKWRKRIRETLKRHAVFKFKCPKVVRNAWQKVFAMRTAPLNEIKRCVQELMLVVAISDETSDELIGSYFGEDLVHDIKEWVIRQRMIAAITDNNFQITNLCMDNVAKTLRVLPKSKIQQRGLTIRTLSRNLALLPNSEVSTAWRNTKLTDENQLNGGLNLLLFPWPMTVFPSQFFGMKGPFDEADTPIGLFGFNLNEEIGRSFSTFEKAYKKAEQQFGSVDAVVFPEMAFGQDLFELIRNRMSEETTKFLIGGVYDPPTNNKPGFNQAKIVQFFPKHDSVAPLFSDETQCKHHRWMLDDSQIRTYGLGAQLHPSKSWWEHVEIQERSLQILRFQDGLSISVLICEDLARPDPVSDTIRAIGPNLVVALLQDGPQLSSRWSARYATVLADDPGCSVLTLTGLGMVSLSRPPGVVKPSRVVALWKEDSSALREIELPNGAEAIMLSLSREKHRQWTADGRVTDSNGHLSLSGVNPVFL